MGAMRARNVLVTAIVAILIALALASVASAANFSVNDPTDAPLATSTDTNCVSTNGGSCTLRAAVQAADTAGGASTIVLPANTYKLTIPPGYPSPTAPNCTPPNAFGGDQCDANDAATGDL